MTSSTVKRRNDRKLNTLVTEMVDSMARSLETLDDRPLQIRAKGTMHVIDRSGWSETMNKPQVLVRGVLDQGSGGKGPCFLFDTAADTVVARGVNDMLDRMVGQEIGDGIGLVIQERTDLGPGEYPSDHLPEGNLVAYPFLLRIEDLENAEGFVVFDQATAETLNEGPLELDEEDEIPQAPIRGKLAAYLVKAEAYRTISRSCRREGLEVQRFQRGDIPNPAAHKNEVVLIEIPVGEDRRFNWARRLKDHPRYECMVVLLLHAPSRRRVVQGCLAKADAIIAWPCTEPQLSEKLHDLLQRGPDRRGDDPDGDLEA